MRPTATVLEDQAAVPAAILEFEDPKRIGYESHDTKTVKLYFSGSFTFRVLDPAAVIVLKG